jgi:hypothetical protein
VGLARGLDISRKKLSLEHHQRTFSKNGISEKDRQQIAFIGFALKVIKTITTSC